MDVFILCLVALVSMIQGSAQNAALKFDEFTDSNRLRYEEAESYIRSRTERLAKRLRLERNKKVFIIHYRARVLEDEYRYRLPGWVQHVRWRISDTVVKADSVFVIDGGLRHFDTIEFWIGPTNAEPPKPTPTFSRAEAIDCPRVFAYQDGLAFSHDTRIFFVSEPHSPSTDVHEWTISGGRIVGDTGGSTLEVDVSNVKADRITAFVEIKGIPSPCKNRAYATGEFGYTPRLTDEFGPIPNGDFRGRLDSFFTTLMNHPEKQGYAYIYGGRDARRKDVEARERLLKSQIFFRNFDPSRIKIIDAGFRDEISTEFWLVPRGVDAPTPTPTVDAKFAVSPRPKRSARQK